MTSNLGADTITGFDTTDVDLGGSNSDGDWLALLGGDVRWGTTGSIVVLTDWASDATHDPSSTKYDLEPQYDTVGSPNVTIANASVIIVRTMGASDDDALPGDNFPDWKAGTETDISDDFDYDYTDPSEVDLMLSRQNGTFEGSVFVLTDDGPDTATGNVYLWWDADAKDSSSVGLNKVDTVLIGTFTDIDDAEAFLGNIQLLSSFPT